MTAKTYRLDPQGTLSLTDKSGPGLDAISLTLPEGIYTTLRTYAGDHILGLTAHLQRLIDSHIRLERPRAINVAAIRAALREVIRREALPALRLRLTTPFEDEAVFISVEPFEAYPPEYYTQGVRCATSHLERATPEAKYTAFIAPSRSEKAQSEGVVHEKLMVNAQGEILEGFSSNFYAVLEGRLHTASEGVLAGVTRKVVLAEAEGLVPVVLTPVKVSDLPFLTEAFLTSSGREVMPVRQIDEIVLGAPGPVTQALMARYQAHVLKDAERP